MYTTTPKAWYTEILVCMDPVRLHALKHVASARLHGNRPTGFRQAVGGNVEQLEIPACAKG